MGQDRILSFIKGEEIDVNIGSRIINGMRLRSE